MLFVDAEGNFEGSVSSGCLEGEVIKAAMDVIATNKVQHLRFGSKGDGSWQAIPVCGGEMEIFLQPLGGDASSAFGLSLVNQIEQKRMQNEAVAVVTDLVSGSSRLVSPAETRSLVDDEPIRFGKTKAGSNIFFHVIAPSKLIVLVGAVHIAQVLAEMASLCGFKVIVNDPRISYLTRERFPGVELCGDWPGNALEKQIMPGNNSALVALSHDPKIDDQALKIALDADCFFVGALGSSRSHVKRIERLRQLGVVHEAIDRISAPVGIDIGATNPTEIAPSILSEIIVTMRGQKWS
jgi:xanthine dehydrogenase accessory factor